MFDQYRHEYSEFHTASMREHYLFLSGQKPTLEIAPIYERFSDLFTLEVIAKLKVELNQISGHFETARKSLNRFLLFSVEQFLEDSVKSLTEQINEYESAATVQWNGQPMTFHDAAVRLAVESNRETRRAIQASRAAIIEGSNDLRAERLGKIHQAALGLGEPSYRALFESLRGIDYAALAGSAREMLTATESTYLRAIESALPRTVGVSLNEAERFDAVYFLHLTEYDEHFPVDGLVPTYMRTMSQLGIDASEQGHIFIDSEPRPRKTARAFCMPISVPDDVRLVIRPSGGQSDYQSLLHESGHAQHYGWTASSLAPEFKYTGDYALTETYAFLMNHLVSDGEWLAETIGFRDTEEFTRSVMLARLVTVRRYAAKLVYELSLHDGADLSSAAALYAELQTAATGFNTQQTEFLYDLDDCFYSAGYLRAWALEVALRDYLKTRYGVRWWASTRAGSLLKELWETGDLYNADEMASQLGLAPISFDMLIEEFNRALK
ncbi:MAG TPA: hypothetical protein VKM94_22710 [Blastocatellia bacterium]|nr:hypothetical protein [Blastocatellia bacterium]